MLTVAPTTADDPAGLRRYSRTTDGKTCILFLVSLSFEVVPSLPAATPPAPPTLAGWFAPPVFGTAPGSPGGRDVVVDSFVRSVDEVRALHAELDRLQRPRVGVVLKIETRAGFENLPSLLFEGLRRPTLGVMIARGDLAVEVGFERLAEIQEEILWLCEAAHVPAIWATQVLDTLARTGVPSRAEVTDASASVAAECVMLNKGPFIHEAVTVLCSILRRMEQHHYKKRSLFRKLEVSKFE